MKNSISLFQGDRSNKYYWVGYFASTLFLSFLQCIIQYTFSNLTKWMYPYCVFCLNAFFSDWLLLKWVKRSKPLVLSLIETASVKQKYAVYQCSQHQIIISNSFFGFGFFHRHQTPNYYICTLSYNLDHLHL